MSDTEEAMDTTNDKTEPENATPTKRAAVVKRQKEILEDKKDADELEDELGGVDDIPEEDDEGSDQEYTTKKKKPVKPKETALDPAFQSRLVKKQLKFNKNFIFNPILFLFRMKIKLNGSIIYLNKLKFFHISYKMVN